MTKLNCVETTRAIFCYHPYLFVSVLLQISWLRHIKTSIMCDTHGQQVSLTMFFCLTPITFAPFIATTSASLGQSFLTAMA